MLHLQSRSAKHQMGPMWFCQRKKKRSETSASITRPAVLSISSCFDASANRTPFFYSNLCLFLPILARTSSKKRKLATMTSSEQPDHNGNQSSNADKPEAKNAATNKVWRTQPKLVWRTHIERLDNGKEQHEAQSERVQ